MLSMDALAGVEPESVEEAKRRRDILAKLDKEAQKAPGGPYREALECMKDFIEGTDPRCAFQPAMLPKLTAAFRALASTAKQPFQVPAVLVDATQFLGDHAAGMAARAAGAGIALPKGLAEKIAAGAAAMESLASAVVDMMTAARRGDAPEILGSADAPPIRPDRADKWVVPADLKDWVNPALGRIENK